MARMVVSISAGRGKLPVWVVRRWLVLRFMLMGILHCSLMAHWTAAAAVASQRPNVRSNRTVLLLRRGRHCAACFEGVDMHALRFDIGQHRELDHVEGAAGIG